MGHPSFLFQAFRKPKIPLDHGRDEDAVKVFDKIVKYKGKISEFMLEDL